MNVITLRDYAKQNNISYEAVRKQVVRYADELGDHIIKDGRQQFLDEEAVAFLDAKRQKNPVAIIQMDKDDQIESLERENKDLLLKIAIQADQIAELSAWKADNAIAIAESNQRQLLLEEKTEQVEALVKEKTLLEGFVQDAKAEIEAQKAEKADLSAERDFYIQKGAEALEKAENVSNELTEAEEYAKALEDWTNLPWFKRIRTPKPIRENKE